jgi:hypothetical protein
MDLYFDSSSSFNGQVYSMIVDVANSAIYAAGAFSSYQGNSRQCIAKLSAIDAAIVGTFDTSTGLNSCIGPTSPIVLYGSNLYLGGSFTTYKGTSRYYVAKASAVDGSIDNTFDSSTGYDNAAWVLLQDGLSLLCGGAFTSYKGLPKISANKVLLTTAAQV